MDQSQIQMVAFLDSALRPRVAAACAHASSATLSNESGNEGSPGGPLSQPDAEGAILSAAKVISAAKDGLAAAAMKGKLFADHEECEIQLLSANIINHQIQNHDRIQNLHFCHGFKALWTIRRPMRLPGGGNGVMNNSPGNKSIIGSKFQAPNSLSLRCIPTCL